MRWGSSVTHAAARDGGTVELEMELASSFKAKDYLDMCYCNSCRQLVFEHSPHGLSRLNDSKPS